DIIRECIKKASDRLRSQVAKVSYRSVRRLERKLDFLKARHRVFIRQRLSCGRVYRPERAFRCPVLPPLSIYQYGLKHCAVPNNRMLYISSVLDIVQSQTTAGTEYANPP